MNEQLTLNDQFQYSDLQSGMLVQEIITIPAGSFIYRFAASDKPYQTQISSPWWFTEQEFQKLQRYFRLNTQNLGFIARAQGAVKYEWSMLDLLIKAVTQQPIKGFTGPGKWVMEKTPTGSTITFQAPADLFQFYLPNLRDPQTKGLSKEGQLALTPFPAIPIPSGDAMDDRIRTMVGKNIFIPGNPRLH